jgi:hypothetical protein
MAITDQKYRPIALLLMLNGFPVFAVLFNVPWLGTIRPEQIHLTRPARGTVTHTTGAAFIDDYGEGMGTLTIMGHTGWNAGLLPGILKFKAIEQLFIQYLALRQTRAAGGLDPDAVQLWWLDTLDLEALAVYPHEFVLEKTKSRPLLYFYRMRFSVTEDLLQGAITRAVAALSPVLGTAFAAVRGLFP